MTVIADISVSSDDFVLGQTMQAVPASRIELEQLVPSGALSLPYFWVEEVNVEEAEAALSEESAVKAVSQLDVLDGRVLSIFTRASGTRSNSSVSANPSAGSSNRAVLGAVDVPGVCGDGGRIEWVDSAIGVAHCVCLADLDSIPKFVLTLRTDAHVPLPSGANTRTYRSVTNPPQL